MTAVQRSVPVQTWARTTAWAGIAFFPVFIVGILMGFGTPDSKDSDAKWRSWFGDSGNRAQLIIGMYLLVIAAVLFLIFASGLLARLGGPQAAFVPYRVAAATATAFAVLLMVGAVQLAVIAGNVSFGDLKVPNDADLMRHTSGPGLILIPGALSAAAFLVAAALLARSNGLFPNWLVILSYVFAVILIAAVIFLPLAALPIWVLIVSIVLLRGRVREQVAAAY
jgi:hypothetical protein